MVHPRTAPALATLVVVAGASVFAVAQMGPSDNRRLPYQGYIENGGSPAQTGEYNLRFGLFVTANADASCLATDPNSCPLWGEEQTTTVTEGNFSVVLGESNPLDNDVINQTALFLGIAVHGPNDSVFTVLDSKQELLAVPFAARAAQAQDYNVVGSLTADSVAAQSGDFLNAAAQTLDVDSAQFNEVLLRTGGANVRISDEGASNGVALRALTNPASGEPIFSVLSEGGAERLRVEHDGETSISNDLTVTGNANVSGDMSISGSLNFGCPANWVRAGRWCIHNTLAGSANGSNFGSVSSTCHSRGGGVCSIDALLACDSIEPAGATCSTTTDQAQWLWTSGTISTNDQNAFGRIQIFNGQGNDSTNEGDVVDDNVTTAAGQPIRAFCCRAAGGF